MIKYVQFYTVSIIVFQVSGSQETFHQIFKRVQKVAEGVLVHPLQQGQQDPGIKVGEKSKLNKIPDKKKKIPEKTLQWV